ncbi:MAG: type 4a pilus biogenesis protein PilO [Planctomycetota bacterium]|jgi:Tfp pilus assembly protein PilO
MKKLDKQQLIILALGVLISGGFGIFRYIPIVRQKYAIQKQVEQQNLVIDEICSQSALIPELRQRKNRLQKQLLPFTQKVPQGRNLATLWRQVAEMMNECKLTDQLVQPGDELKSEELCSIPLTIECKGSMEQIFAFFQSLENIDRLIRFEKVSLENGNDFNTEVKLKAQANVYYQPNESDNG